MQPTIPVQAPKATKLLLSSDDFIDPATVQGIGLVAPFDFALDSECWRWLPPDVSLFLTRTPPLVDTAVTIDLAKEVSSEAAVSPAVGSLLATKPASVAYASFVGGVTGEKKLQNIMIQAGAPIAVTTSGALVLALRHINVKRIAIATPYNESLTNLLADYLKEASFEVVSSGFLDMEAGIATVSYNAVKRMARTIDHSDAEAIFFSCTNLRTFDIIQELESELGKPVLSANQVTMWAALQLGNLPIPRLPQCLFQA